MPVNYPNEVLCDTATLLETICPEKILLIGDAVQHIANPYQEQCDAIKKACEITVLDPSTQLSNPAFSKRYDLAIVAELIESDNKQHAEHLIGRLRDLCAPCIILLAKLDESPWKENELFGYGFNKYNQQQFIDHEANIYHHNINSYKRTPDWFNPKNWANPQLWNKFWW